MPLSWNEIKHRAIAFSKAWSTETSEDAEAKSFWDAFFMVFGVQRRTVASFEEPVKKLSGQLGYIDLFWPGTMLAEHKSADGSQAYGLVSKLSYQPDWRGPLRSVRQQQQ